MRDQERPAVSPITAPTVIDLHPAPRPTVHISKRAGIALLGLGALLLFGFAWAGYHRSVQNQASAREAGLPKTVTPAHADDQLLRSIPLADASVVHQASSPSVETPSRMETQAAQNLPQERVVVRQAPPKIVSPVIPNLPPAPQEDHTLADAWQLEHEAMVAPTAIKGASGVGTNPKTVSPTALAAPDQAPDLAAIGKALGLNAAIAAASATARLSETDYEAQNDHTRKAAFFQAARNRSVTEDYLRYTREAPLSRFEIKAGWEIPALLEQSLNSDLPGELKALVTANVYDTATGQYLLIPQGARLIGNYDSRVSYGQDGVQVVWNRIIFPDASSIDLLSHTMSFGPTAVNEARLSFTRLNNVLGAPQGGVGPSLANQGFATGPTGIQPGLPEYLGVETLYFNTFTIGANPFALSQVDNTWGASDSFSKVRGNHTIKFGGQYTRFAVKQLPDLVANGSFSFFGSGAQSTGNGFADFLLGLPDNYSQQSSPSFYELSINAGVFAEDSWRLRPNLTLNYGLRWDYIRPWSEEHNQIATLIYGENSVQFPGTPTGYVLPGDPGVASTIAPAPLNDFSPRFGLAWSPGWSTGLLKKLTGGAGKTSIRVGVGRFFTSIEGLTVAYPTGNPPYGLTYVSPEPPQFAQPFVGALTGKQYPQQFPVNVPPYNVSPTNPFLANWSQYEPYCWPSYSYSKSLDWSSNLQEQVDPYDYRREYGPSAFDIRQDFVVSYNYELPLQKLFHSKSWLAHGWALSGIARLATGLPVTFASFGDNSLMGVGNNGVNGVSIDLPDVVPGNLDVNHNPRNGKPYFNTSLFTPNPIGTFGNSARRAFYGPGMDNFDMALHKITKIKESRILEIRFEAVNAFNHTQFFGPNSVNGNIDSATFGYVTQAASPRISQVAAKFMF